MARRMRRLPLLTLLVSLVASAQTLPSLIPRDVLLGNPERYAPQVSPDGKRLIYAAPDKKNVMQVYLRTLGQTDDAVITDDKKRGIRRFEWAPDGTGVLFQQDADGDENFHLFHVDLASKNVRDLTPFQGVRGELLSTRPKFKDTVLATVNLRDRKTFDVYRISLKTGAVELDTQNPGDVQGWVTDAAFVVRAAIAATPDGGKELRVRDSAKSPWRSFIKVGPEETIEVEGFTLDGKGLYVSTSIDADTTRLVEKNLKSGTERVLAKNDKTDVGEVLVHPTKFNAQAVAFEVNGRKQWVALDGSLKSDFEGIAKLAEGDITVVSRDDADQVWMVGLASDRFGVKYYTWERGLKRGTFLFALQPKLEGLTLCEMKPMTVTTRDGLELPVLLTTPAGLPAKNLPMVLLVHGGPWAADHWG